MNASYRLGYKEGILAAKREIAEAIKKASYQQHSIMTHYELRLDILLSTLEEINDRNSPIAKQ